MSEWTLLELGAFFVLRILENIFAMPSFWPLAAFFGRHSSTGSMGIGMHKLTMDSGSLAPGLLISFII